MFITAKDMEEEFRAKLASMDAEGVMESREAVTARLRAMGMFGLATDLDAARENRDNADIFARLYATVGVLPYGGVVIEDLTPTEIEFECLYGLTDPASNDPSREITFSVRDKNGRVPVYLEPENIILSFSLNAREGDLACSIKYCDHNKEDMSTAVGLDVRISDEAFGAEGEFILRIAIRLGGTVAASQNVRFIVKNTFPTFFREDLTALPATMSKKPPPPLPPPPKEILIMKTPIQTRQKNTRVAFDKERGGGVPLVLCGNSAFRPGLPTRSAVNITFRLPSYKTLERRLVSSGLTMRFPPETPIWVEWEDVVVVYTMQYKGFLI